MTAQDREEAVRRACVADESSCFDRDCPKHAGLDALRSIVDPDEVPRCVDCGVEVDGLGPPICRECAE